MSKEDFIAVFEATLLCANLDVTPSHSPLWLGVIYVSIILL